MGESPKPPQIKLPSFKDVQKRSVEKSRLQPSFRASTSITTNSGPIAERGEVAENPGNTHSERPRGESEFHPFRVPFSAASTAASTARDGVISIPQDHLILRNDTPAPCHQAPVPQHQQGWGFQPSVSGHSTYSAIVGHGNPILVNRNQQGNPVLAHIRNVNYQFADVIPDFLFNDQVAAVFLSLKFHLLKPHYMASRVKALNREFRTFIMCLCDIEDPVNPLAEISQQAVDMHLTLIVAFSEAECGRYLELLKAYGNKSVDALKPHTERDYVLRVARVLTQVRAVNRTDSALMGSHCRSLADILRLGEADLKAIPGIGPHKATRLFSAFDAPFYVDQQARGTEQQTSNGDKQRSLDADTREWIATQQVHNQDTEISDDDIVNE